MIHDGRDMPIADDRTKRFKTELRQNVERAHKIIMLMDFFSTAIFSMSCTESLEGLIYQTVQKLKDQLEGCKG